MLTHDVLTGQVLFSSSVMYGNFVTIAQRRVMAKEAQEHKDRYITTGFSLSGVTVTC